MERYEEMGGIYHLDGMAKERGMKNLCKKKLCVFSTDQQFLFDLLQETSRANDCFYVKVFKESRLNIYFGQCTFTNESSLGDAWARYESNPKVWVVIHDGDFSDQFKNRIRTY